MDIIIKQRILGSLVLIAIAIVFVPALLSGNASVFHQSLQSNIPEKPAFVIDLSEEQKLRVASDNEKMAARMASGELASNTESAHYPLSETLPATASDKPTVQQQAAASITPASEKTSTTALVATKPIATQDMSFGPDHTPSQASATLNSANSSANSSAKNNAKTTVTAQKIAKISPQAATLANKASATAVTSSSASATKASVATIAKVATKKNNATVSKANATSKLAKGWIVQVASFREPANATALQQRLARHGMESSVIKNRSKNGMLYRVRLGPWDRKQTAAQQQAALEKIVNLDTLLLKLH